MYKFACLLLVGLFGAVYSVPSTYDTEQVWVAGNLSYPLPKNVLVGGVDSYGYKLYVARTNFTGILPVRVVAETGTGSFNTETASSTVVNYQLLKTQDNQVYEWVRSYDGFLEEGAISVGTSAWNERVYVCRAHVDGGVLFGTLYLTRKACHIKGTQYYVQSFDKYEVLVSVPKSNGTFY